MPHCIVKQCHNSDRNNPRNARFHLVPTGKRRKYVRRQWLAKCARPEPKDPQAHVCSEHFKFPDDYSESMMKYKMGFINQPLLNGDAVPSVFLVSSPTRTPVRPFEKSPSASVKRRRTRSVNPSFLVWLAALRETEKHDSAEQHQICEDHFLPEDISTEGVKGDAIPIMPPCLEGPLGVINPWGAASSEEEEEDCDEEEDDEEDEGLMYVEPPAPKPPAAEPPKQAPVVKNSSAAKTTRGHPRKSSPRTKPSSRYNLSLGLLTQRFLELLLAAPDGVVDLGQVTASLQTRRRRVYDITAVLEGISVLQRQSVNHFKWIGSTSISSFLWQNQQKLQRELDSLKLVEDTLDSLIKSCAQQLFSMTDDLDNATSAYVTHEDVGRLAAFQQQTVIVVKAPEETKLEVPAPKEDNIQVHLKGGRGPIMVLTCEVGGADASRHFLALEESRITTNTLHTESSNPQSAVQSA